MIMSNPCQYDAVVRYSEQTPTGVLSQIVYKCKIDNNDVLWILMIIRASVRSKSNRHLMY